MKTLEMMLTDVVQDPENVASLQNGDRATTPAGERADTEAEEVRAMEKRGVMASSSLMEVVVAVVMAEGRSMVAEIRVGMEGSKNLTAPVVTAANKSHMVEVEAAMVEDVMTNTVNGGRSMALVVMVGSKSPTAEAEAVMAANVVMTTSTAKGGRSMALVAMEAVMGTTGDTK